MVLWHITQIETHTPGSTVGQSTPEHTGTQSRKGFVALQCTGIMLHAAGEHPLQVRWIRTWAVIENEFVYPLGVWAWLYFIKAVGPS